MDVYGSKEEMQKGVDDIKAMIEALEVGQSCIYHTGFTGWMDALPYNIGNPLIEWFKEIKEENKPTHVFSQRKIDEVGQRGVFEYICKRIK